MNCASSAYFEKKIIIKLINEKLIYKNEILFTRTTMMVCGTYCSTDMICTTIRDEQCSKILYYI